MTHLTLCVEGVRRRGSEDEQPGGKLKGNVEKQKYKWLVTPV